MKVKQLISLLEKVDQDADVFIHGYDSKIGYYISDAEWAATQSREDRVLLYAGLFVEMS